MYTSIDMKIQNSLSKNIAKLFLGGALGYGFFWLTSHPTKSPVRKKLPEKKIKNIHILPEIHVEAKGKRYHLHHWINVSFLYGLLYATRKRHNLLPKIFHGFLIGSILQGLTYKDRFRLIHTLEKKLTDLKEEVVNELK